MIINEKRYQFIGKKLREAREGAGLSQKQMAEMLGYESATAISLLEAGDRKISVVDLEKISSLLHRDIKFFLGKEGEEATVQQALRADKDLSEEDRNALLHIVEMAKKKAYERRVGKNRGSTKPGA